MRPCRHETKICPQDKETNGNMESCREQPQNRYMDHKSACRNDRIIRDRNIGGKNQSSFRWKKDHPYVPVRIHAGLNHETGKVISSSEEKKLRDQSWLIR